MNIWKSYTENSSNLYSKLIIYADIDYKNSIVDNERTILLDFFERNLQKVKDIFHAQGQDFIFISREKFSWVNSEQELLVFVNFFPTHYTTADIPNLLEAFTLRNTAIDFSENDNPYRFYFFNENITSELAYNVLLYALKKNDFILLRFFRQIAYQKNHFTDYKISYAIDLDFDKVIAQTDKKTITVSKLYNSTYQDFRAVENVLAGIKQLQTAGLAPLLVDLLGVTNPIAKTLVNNQNEVLKEVKDLLITDYFKIFVEKGEILTEIALTPIHKALYFLFLIYPEGIIAKNLSDYTQELLEIYKHLAYKESYQEMQQSIADLTNPLKNSFNEKCSRIKEVFQSHFAPNIAKNYYITGEKGKHKTILLDRSRVTIANEFLANLLPTQESKENFEKLFESGISNLLSNDFATALYYFDKILKKYTQHLAAVWNNKGNCYAGLLDFEQAIHCYHTALQYDEQLQEPYSNLGKICVLQKDFDKAIGYLQKSLSLGLSLDGDEHFYLGLAYLETKQLYKAYWNILDAASDYQHLEATNYIEHISKLKQFKESYRDGSRYRGGSYKTYWVEFLGQSGELYDVLMAI